MDDSPTLTDPEALLDALVDSSVVSVDPETDTVTTTAEFEDTRGIYHDSYATVSDETFHRSVAEVFGFDSTELAAERVDELGVTREEFIVYLTLVDHLDGSYTTEERTRMAAMVAATGPDTPVPDGIETLTDESYEAFVSLHDRAIVTVWKHHCDPCEAMKDELDAILAAVPDEVTVGGLDGERCGEFRRAYDIDAAPAMVLFADGDFREGFAGRATPERVAAACAEVYDSS